MRRRAFLVASAAALAAPLARAQRAAPRRIGFLQVTSRADGLPGLDAFRAGLASRGHREGAGLVIEARFANGSGERFAAMAEALVRASKVDVLVIGSCGNPWMGAVRRASRTLPLVVASCGDLPGFIGEVASFAKPGGRTTGQTTFAPELAAKRLQLLKTLVPDLASVAVIWNPASEGWDPYWAALRRAASALGFDLHSAEARDVPGLDAALAGIGRSRAGGLLTLVDGLLWTKRGRIIEFARARRLPAAYEFEQFAQDGGLLSYGPSLLDGFRGAAGQVANILNGANPGDLPIERPATLRLVVNRGAAQALGIAIPTSLLAQADRVIE